MKLSEDVTYKLVLQV